MLTAMSVETSSGLDMSPEGIVRVRSEVDGWAEDWRREKVAEGSREEEGAV
jgi:hypothetical protein